MNATSETDRRGDEAVTTSFAFMALATLFAAIRIYGRLVVVKKPGIDDLLLVGALAMSAAFSGLVKAQTQHGLGRHVTDLAPGEYAKMLKPFWASVIVYNVGLTFVKCSILCQFFRFFIEPKARATCWIALGTVATFGVCTMFGSIFACAPIAFFWDKKVPGGHCIDLLAFWFMHAAFNIVSDLVIIILPIPVLIPLSLPCRQKYALILIFILGGFTCITSILRLPSLYQISKSTDLTYDNTTIATWSSIELNTGIICACLVTLKPVLSLVFPQLDYSKNSRHYSIELSPHHNLSAQPSASGNRSTDMHRTTPSSPRRSSIGRKPPWHDVEEMRDGEQNDKVSHSKTGTYTWSITATP